MSYDITGKVKLVGESQTFGSGFEKRELVIIVPDGKYDQEINIEFVQGNTVLLENIQVGQNVSITFDIRGREYNGRYFNNLVGWKIAAEASSSPAQPAAPAVDDKPPVSDSDIPVDFDEDEDDIPF